MRSFTISHSFQRGGRKSGAQSSRVVSRSAKKILDDSSSGQIDWTKVREFIIYIYTIIGVYLF